jgi:hypothetical protein
MGYRLVVLRVKVLAFGVNALKAFLGKDFEQRTCDLLDVGTSTMCERQVGRVQDREQLFDKSCRRIFEYFSLLAVNALAVVVKLGLEAEQGLEVLVALARHLGERRQRVLGSVVRDIYLVRRAIYVLAAFTRHA